MINVSLTHPRMINVTIVATNVLKIIIIKNVRIVK